MPQSSECSPDRPWGYHPAVIDSLCPRCGWSAGGRQPAREADPAEEVTQVAA